MAIRILLILVLFFGIGYAQDALTPQEDITFKFKKTVYRQVIFSVTEDGKLDVKLEGYAGASDAAADFLKYLKDQDFCPPCPEVAK
jgi:hypothetical protein